MSEDERDIDVELDDGDLGGMDDEGGSLAGDDGIPENKRYLNQARLANIMLQLSVLCTMQWREREEILSRTASGGYRCSSYSFPTMNLYCFQGMYSHPAGRQDK